MSNNDRTYGIDIAYSFKNDGTVDLALDDSGDIALVGGSALDTKELRRKNAVQQIILRILTRNQSLLNEEGKTIEFGSELHSLKGVKNNDINRLAVKAYIISCLQDYVWIESITKIDVDIQETGVISVQLGIRLIDDTEVIEETINLGG